MKLLKLLLGIHKTIYLNFKLLPLFDAVKLPIWVTCNTKIRIMGGACNRKRKNITIYDSHRFSRM